MNILNRHDILTSVYPHFHTLEFLIYGEFDKVFIGECDRESLDDKYKLIGRDYAEKLAWAGLIDIVESQWDPHFADGSGQIVCITDIGRAYVRIAEEYADRAEEYEAIAAYHRLHQTKQNIMERVDKILLQEGVSAQMRLSIMHAITYKEDDNGNQKTRKHLVQ